MGHPTFVTGAGSRVIALATRAASRLLTRHAGAGGMTKGRAALNWSSRYRGMDETRPLRTSEFDPSLEGDHAWRAVTAYPHAQQSRRRGDRAGQGAKAGL